MFDKFFGKKDKAPQLDPLADLTLANLQPGWMVDYDLKTWQVQARHEYKWGESDRSVEWHIQSEGEVYFLEMEGSDGDDWSLNQKLAFGRLDPSIKQSIIDNGDPPDRIELEGQTFYMEEMAGGYYLKDGQAPGREMLRWSYENDDSSQYLGIEQWGELEFQASQGRPVAEYQFTNILPAAEKDQGR